MTPSGRTAKPQPNRSETKDGRPGVRGEPEYGKSADRYSYDLGWGDNLLDPITLDIYFDRSAGLTRTKLRYR